MGSLPKATLPKIAKFTFSVGVYGFEADEPVEISGYATQTGGAFANIYQIEQVPAMADPSVDVTVETRSSKQFSKDEEVHGCYTGGGRFGSPARIKAPGWGGIGNLKPPDGSITWMTCK